MRILVTGANGFVGKNLVCALENIKSGKDRTHPGITVDEIYRYDIDSDSTVLDTACKNADFVFNLAGVNRPKEVSEFVTGNVGFAKALTDTLEKHGNTCPVMLSSSVQATLEGRYDSDYGRSKRAGEELFFDYGERSGAPVFVYRFPNLFGKWCRPNYNSVVATFCHNTANGLPITVTDRNISLTLAYIDDVTEELLRALGGAPTRDGRFCKVPVTHTVTLGEICGMLDKFSSQPSTLVMPEIPDGSFEKKLYSTYLSYLPADKASFALKMNVDGRGSFTELLKTEKCGQFSVNISKPGITKGEHWHNTKWEFFIVVSGKGLIRQRKIGSDEILDFYVSGDEIRAVHMLPGYTHNIINLSDTDELVTLMWANECFDPAHPDTFFEKVDE